MLEYVIGSGLVCMASSRIVTALTKSRMEKLGYVGIKSLDGKKKTVKDYVLGTLSNFIPVINNIAGLFFLGTSGYMMFASDDSVRCLFNKMPNVKKASEAKDIYERRIKANNFSAMEDAMKLDGADEATIKSEIELAKHSCGIVDDKTMKKINAMSDSELWLLDIEMNVGLTDSEKKELYKDYVKAFSSEKQSSKVIEKTIKMTSSMNR